MVSLARDFLKSRAIVAVRSFLVFSVLRWLSGPGNATLLRKTPGSERVLLRGPEDARNFFFIALPLPVELRTALAREPMATTGHKLSNNTSVP